jgi:hypothetical protein
MSLSKFLGSSRLHSSLSYRENFRGYPHFAREVSYLDTSRKSGLEFIRFPTNPFHFVAQQSSYLRWSTVLTTDVWKVTLNTSMLPANVEDFGTKCGYKNISLTERTLVFYSNNDAPIYARFWRWFLFASVHSLVFVQRSIFKFREKNWSPLQSKE